MGLPQSCFPLVQASEAGKVKTVPSFGAKTDTAKPRILGYACMQKNKKDGEFLHLISSENCVVQSLISSMCLAYFMPAGGSCM